ncbi:MAG TPA: sensor histidine kinase [Streptosporangiaceae bacterium]|jgi:signal transduction histidine kinase
MRTDRVLPKLFAAGWVTAAGITLVAFRLWQGRLREAEQRAVEAERTRDETARRRAVEERLRIARELHDSLTHSISVIKVQAGVAVHLARKRGEEVPAALQAIQEASSDASQELRATLSVLREQDVSVGLAQLPGMVSRATAAGLPVTVSITGTECPLPAEVDRAAYRIVQEALTNVTRHAGQATVSVQISYGTSGLTLRVDDDGTGGQARPPEAETLPPEAAAPPPEAGLPAAEAWPPAPAPGMGITGMRERATALGGQLQAGPRPGGGFRVLAELPLQAPS